MSGTTCPDCGALVPAGRKLCQNCLYPVYLADLPEDERDDVSPEDIELPTGQQPAIDAEETAEAEIRAGPEEGERTTDPFGAQPVSTQPRTPQAAAPPRSVAVVVLLTVGVTALAIIAVAFVISLTRDDGPAEDPFSGRWASVGADGSIQSIEFTGSGDRRDVRKTDSSSSRCGGVSATASGRGRLLTSLRLTVTFQVACSNGRQVPQRTTLFTYDPAARTLEESTGVVWRRAGN